MTVIDDKMKKIIVVVIIGLLAVVVLRHYRAERNMAIMWKSDRNAYKEKTGKGFSWPK